MSTPKRAQIFSKLHKVAKQNFDAVNPSAQRTVLEHLMFACCLQNSDFDQSEQALARIQQSYFDWNEVRVTTVQELAQVMSCLSEPKQAATRLKKTLTSVFETHYAFDIDFLRKENLGKAIHQLDRGRGVTPFVLAYVAQNALGGHQIPIDEAMLELMYVIGAIDDKQNKDFKITGLERSIPKTKGVEFFSTVHQLAVAFHHKPHKPETRKMILAIDPAAAERYPKRTSSKSTSTKSKTGTKRSTSRKAANSSPHAAGPKRTVAKKKSSSTGGAKGPSGQAAKSTQPGDSAQSAKSSKSSKSSKPSQSTKSAKSAKSAKSTKSTKSTKSAKPAKSAKSSKSTKSSPASRTSKSPTKSLKKKKPR